MKNETGQGRDYQRAIAIFDSIRSEFSQSIGSEYEIEDKRFHHCTSYANVVDIIETGILSRQMKEIIIGKKISEKEYLAYNDENYANHLDYISLSSLYGDKVRKNRFMYDSSSELFVDIIVNSQVKKIRNSRNYDNEYLVRDFIGVKDFNSIDIRFLSLLNSLELKFRKTRDIKYLEQALENFDHIIELSKKIIDENISIPFREMSSIPNLLKPEIILEQQHKVKKASLNI